jgi:hypothetical protein
VHPRHVLRQEDGGLAPRVPSTDHDDGVADAQSRFGDRGGVVHARPLEAVEAGNVEVAVAHPCGEQHGAAGDDGAVVEMYQVAGLAGLERGRPRRYREAGAELPGLEPGPFGQVGPGDAGREAEVVLDP